MKGSDSGTVAQPFGKVYVPRPTPVLAKRVGLHVDVMDAKLAGAPIKCQDYDDSWSLQTAHGWVRSKFGDWLLTDGKGDWWPVKRTMFEERYVDVKSDGE